jgi:ribosome-associated heat shock protein Hsp15
LKETNPKAPPAAMRLDKWLWAARIYKTRALAAEAATLGRIEVNEAVAKPSRDVKPGDRLRIRKDGRALEYIVRGLSPMRGPAAAAALLVEETPDSIQRRLAAEERRRQGVEPAASIEQGRPTKRDRRKITDWQRWSASVDE